MHALLNVQSMKPKPIILLLLILGALFAGYVVLMALLG
jgi:hypothetical protein